MSRIWCCCRHGFIFQWNVISVVYADITFSRNLFIFKKWFLLWISALLLGVDRPLFSILLAATGEDITSLGIIYCYTEDHWVFFLLINHCINPTLWTFRAFLHIHFFNTFFWIILIRKEDWIQSLKQDYIHQNLSDLVKGAAKTQYNLCVML